MRALRRRGLAVRGAKSGPDYIDPGFHAAATGAPGVNLDSWAMPPDLLDRLAAEQAAGADVLVDRERDGALRRHRRAARGRSGVGGRPGAALRRAGAPDPRRLGPVADRGRDRARLRGARSGGAHRGRDPEPGRERAARADGARGAGAARPAGGRARCTATRRWRCRSGTSGWCRRASMRRSKPSSSGSPT